MSQGDNNLASLAAAARDLFPPEVAVAAVDPRLAQARVLPEEAPAIANAVGRRQREFAAGRAAARQAMADLGVGEMPVPMGADRAPIWPQGVVGSISHTEAHCAAVVTCAPQIQSLGLDLEPDSPLERHLWDEICTPAEMAWLAAQADSWRGRLAKLIFSAKECAFKCQYPLTRKHLSFQDARIRLNLRESSFEADFNPDISPLNAHCWQGRYRSEAGMLVVGMVSHRAITCSRDDDVSSASHGRAATRRAA